ncbi:MAG TPA: hypothetical protein VE860_18950 [Chthoniobacterales bacterium]|nr:hypothetical protein [Chthoniobacterales bacterium]
MKNEEGAKRKKIRCALIHGLAGATRRARNASHSDAGGTELAEVRALPVEF